MSSPNFCVRKSSSRFWLTFDWLATDRFERPVCKTGSNAFFVLEYAFVR